MKKIYTTFLMINIFFSGFGQVSNFGIDDFSIIQQEFYTNYTDTIQDTNYLKTIKNRRISFPPFSPPAGIYHIVQYIDGKEIESLKVVKK